MNEERINKIALARGVPAAELAALKAEARAGIRPVAVSDSGYLEGLDSRHLLVSGARSYKGIVNGAALYDPVTDEVALVIPEGRRALVRVGALEIRDLIPARGRWNKILLASVDHARNAGREGRRGVSNWLARRVSEAALQALSKTAVSTGKDLVVPRNADAIWEALGRSWVSQPWGTGLEQAVMGDMA